MKYKILVALSLLLQMVSTPCYAMDRQQLFTQTKQELKDDKLSEQTVQELQSLVVKSPSDADGLLYLGLCLDRIGITDQAQICFEKAVKQGVQTPDALVALCKEEAKAGRADVAAALLNEGLKKFPDHPEMLYVIGTYFLHKNELGHATIMLQRAYELNPDVPGLPTALGQCMVGSYPQKAVLLASEDLARKPNDLEALKVRGLGYNKLGNNKQAVKDLQPVFEKEPSSTVISYTLADGYIWLGDYEKALRPSIWLVASTALPTVEKSGQSDLFIRAVPHVSEQKIRQEIAAVSKSMMFLKPQFHQSLGRALDKCNKNALAMEEYREAIRLDPQFVDAHFRLGQDLEMHQHNYKAALAEYVTAHNLRPWDENISLAYTRLQDRLSNKNTDTAWKLKNCFSSMFKQPAR